MYRKQVPTREVCKNCDVRIPRNRPKLMCSYCLETKHHPCEKLSKNEAFDIIRNQPYWVCHNCMLNTLPLNACCPAKRVKKAEPKTKFSVVCSACQGRSYSKNNVKICLWCDEIIAHAKCMKGNLGCTKCCENMIPGYHCQNYELTDNVPLNNLIHNPYSSSNIINQIGDRISAEHENDTMWSDISDFLLKCKYVQIKDFKISRENELNVLSLNIRSLSKNIPTINENITDFQKFDILCFNETNCNLEKLPNGTTDLIIDGFYPPILQAPARKSCKGGGLATYIRKTICREDDFENFVPKNMAEPSFDGEFMFTKITRCKGIQKTIILGNVYRSPSSNIDKFFVRLDTTLSTLARHSNKQILIAGDFNIDLIKHESDSNSQQVIDIMSNHGFIQTISRPTRITEHSSTLIDHIYTNNLNRMIKTNVVTVDLSDHLAIVATISLDPTFDRTVYHPYTRSATDEEHTSRIFNAENDEKFNQLIAEENWEPVLQESHAELKYNKFADIYTKHYNTAYPDKLRKKRRNERKDPKPWILPWLEDACNRKNKLYRKFISEPTIANKTKYTKMKKFTEKHITKAKNNYYRKYFEQYKTDSRKQWNMINSLLNRKRKVIDIKKLVDNDGHTVSSPVQIAETFNKYFANIASSLKRNTCNTDQMANNSTALHATYLSNQVRNTIYLRPVDSPEIETYITDLKNKSTSDSKISALKIANTTQNFSHILANVIDASFTQGIFPQELKVAKVVPIHKNGSKTDVSNYRPISLLSTFSKLYEKAMHVRIHDFLESNNALYEMQYDFRKSRSCEHALLSAQTILLDALSKKEIALLLLIDFSKAFDMVDHTILLNKLHHYGIRGIAHDWIKSYLKNREQYVHIKGKNSSRKSLEYGVPQGSILGPLLFVIYINDIPEIQRFAKFILYADDANIILTGKNMHEIEEKFCQLSSALVKWVSCNGLSLNIKKTNYMIFSHKNRNTEYNFQPKINNVPIIEKNSARFLGIIIDNNLNWTEHIRAIASKMSRYLGIMYKLKSILPQAARLAIFHSFVQSHLNYCSLIWGFSAKSNIELLFRAQKKGIRSIMPGYINLFYKDGETPASTKQTFVDYNILTVQNIIVKNALMFMYKINKFSSQLPSSICNIIPDNAPKTGSTYQTCADWLNDYNYCKFRNSINFKGPLLYTEFSGSNETWSSCYTLTSIKNKIKSKLSEMQAQGDPLNWQSENFKLYNINGLRKSDRIASL